MDFESVVRHATLVVQQDMASNDPSHDFLHVQRVQNLALQIARREGVEDLQLLAALLHDLKDHKYAKEGESASRAIRQTLSGRCPEKLIERVIEIVASVSYSKEARGELDVSRMSLEARCVQDADRLDAIGAVGIARCMAYSSRISRPLFVDSKQEANAQNHFHDKLLKLKSMMKTATGRAMAESRHHAMESFLESLGLELGDASSKS